MTLVANDFSLSIRYKKETEGSYPRPEVAGFFLYSGFFDGGEGKIYSQRAPGTRLSNDDVIAILEFIEKRVAGVQNMSRDVASTFDEERRGKKRLLDSLRENVATTQTRIELLSKELGEDGG